MRVKLLISVALLIGAANFLYYGLGFNDTKTGENHKFLHKPNLVDVGYYENRFLLEGIRSERDPFKKSVRITNRHLTETTKLKVPPKPRPISMPVIVKNTPPKIKVKGIFSNGGDKVALIEIENKSSYVAVGEIIAGGYRIKTIESGKVTLSQL